MQVSETLFTFQKDISKQKTEEKFHQTFYFRSSVIVSKVSTWILTRIKSENKISKPEKYSLAYETCPNQISSQLYLTEQKQWSQKEITNRGTL